MTLKENVYSFLLLLIFTLALGGCSSQAIYQNVQDYERKQCMKGPTSELEECMLRASKTYEQYKRERAELKKDK